jgi:hypothetical protein
MNDYAELEFSLHRRSPGRYAIELRFTIPNSDADVRLMRDGPALVEFDFEQIRSNMLDPQAYGAYLSACLFADPALKAAFAQARSSAQALNAFLRLRLFIGPTAPELHSLRWETLRDPLDGSPLLTNQQVLFSRYLSSGDWQPVRLRPRGELRALVMIANPANLAAYKLAPINVRDELLRVAAALGNIAITPLVARGRVHLNGMVERLSEGFDILYLVCHGAIIKGEPRLWLENSEGNAAVIAGSDLVQRLMELEQRPRLIVLASCQSAGSGDESHAGDNGALSALGPRLAEAGVPAVIAMQGNVSMKAMAQFMPIFFKALQRDGQIDHAIALARGTIRERDDFWMPVLFMRLRSGRIWYVPGFARDPKGFSRWPALLSTIRDGRCTPILGFGLVESLMGPSRDIAQRWASTFHFPMAPHQREDLPQVAQYLAVNQAPRFPRDELGQYLHQELLRRYSRNLDPKLQTASLDQLVDAVGALLRQRDPAEPHRMLAQQPFPLYITTNMDNQLESALIEAGKQPATVLCPWNEYVERSLTIYNDRPTKDRPLVYHLFGHIMEPESLVLTEDDYFDYLIGVTSNKDLIPAVVRRALADTALLFLGFQIDDWNFRVFFRSIMNQEGRGRRGRYAHVAVQINPEEGRILEPDGARAYLETYFQSADMSIYWGRADDFIRELQSQLRESDSTLKRAVGG